MMRIIIKISQSVVSNFFALPFSVFQFFLADSLFFLSFLSRRLGWYVLSSIYGLFAVFFILGLYMGKLFSNYFTVFSLHSILDFIVPFFFFFILVIGIILFYKNLTYINLIFFHLKLDSGNQYVGGQDYKFHPKLNKYIRKVRGKYGTDKFWWWKVCDDDHGGIYQRKVLMGDWMPQWWWEGFYDRIMGLNHYDDYHPDIMFTYFSTFFFEYWSWYVFGTKWFTLLFLLLLFPFLLYYFSAAFLQWDIHSVLPFSLKKITVRGHRILFCSLQWLCFISYILFFWQLIYKFKLSFLFSISLMFPLFCIIVFGIFLFITETCRCGIDYLMPWDDHMGGDQLTEADYIREREVIRKRHWDHWAMYENWGGLGRVGQVFRWCFRFAFQDKDEEDIEKVWDKLHYNAVIREQGGVIHTDKDLKLPPGGVSGFSLTWTEETSLEYHLHNMLVRDKFFARKLVEDFYVETYNFWWLAAYDSLGWATDWRGYNAALSFHQTGVFKRYFNISSDNLPLIAVKRPLFFYSVTVGFLLSDLLFHLELYAALVLFFIMLFLPVFGLWRFVWQSVDTYNVVGRERGYLVFGTDLYRTFFISSDLSPDTKYIKEKTVFELHMEKTKTDKGFNPMGTGIGDDAKPDELGEAHNIFLSQATLRDGKAMERELEAMLGASLSKSKVFNAMHITEGLLSGLSPQERNEFIITIRSRENSEEIERKLVAKMTPEEAELYFFEKEQARIAESQTPEAIAKADAELAEKRRRIRAFRSLFSAAMGPGFDQFPRSLTGRTHWNGLLEDDLFLEDESDGDLES